MSNYLIKDVSSSSDHYKLFVFFYGKEGLNQGISFINSQNINLLNVGKELSIFIESLKDYRYLSIDVYDFVRKLLDKHKSKINGKGNEVIAIYNLGILAEPSLELNATQLLKEYSKSTALIILWENQPEIPNQLTWETQKTNFHFDFSDINIKNLQYEI